MKKYIHILSLALVLSSLSAQARFDRTEELIQNLSEDGSCERILNVLLNRNAEAHRLQESAVRRLAVNNKDTVGLQLSHLSDAAYTEAEAVKSLLIKTCLKN